MNELAAAAGVEKHGWFVEKKNIGAHGENAGEGGAAFLAAGQMKRHALFKAGQAELDPLKRAAIFIKANDMVVANQVVIPVVARPSVQTLATKLKAAMSGWDNNTWDIQDWYKDA